MTFLSVNLKTRKAQVTMFIIIGILILIVFGFIYYAASLQSRTRVQTTATKIATEALQSQAITRYTEICVQDTLEKAMVILGKQGGYIYKDQPGSKIPFNIETVRYNTSDVPYLIKPLNNIPPFYPCFTSENAPAYCGFIYNSAIFPNLKRYSFGANLLPRLYKTQGSYSIQSQLEHYLNTMVPKCADFSGLRNIPELEAYEIIEGIPNTETRFDEATVSVFLEYPITLKLGNIPPVTHLVKFTAKVNVRFRDIYEAAQDTINSDNNYLEYRIYDDTIAGVFRGKELGFNRIREDTDFSIIPVLSSSQIIKMTDSMSLIRGEPYTFQFARTNRYPVLDYIPGNYPPKDVADIIVLENDSILIEPVARDPDESVVSYSYKGWKADYVDIWDDATKTMSRQSFPNLWEGSAEFQQSKRRAKIQLTHTDAGYHNTTVRASDSILEDFQIVRILVELVLDSIPIFDNFYDDVPNNFISIEDPFMINLENTAWMIDPSAIYTISLIDKRFGALLFRSNGAFNDPNLIKCIMHPTFEECSIAPNEDITDIESKLYPRQTKLILNISTEGAINQTLIKDLGLNVTNCLSHRDPTHPLPYPYHQLVDLNQDGKIDFTSLGPKFDSAEVDPFTASHICCEENVIRPGKRIVIISDIYTCKPNEFVSNTPAEIAVEEVSSVFPSAPKLKYKPVQPSFTAGQGTGKNNIYVRTFWQNCGYRGNALSGRAGDEYRLVYDCAEPDTTTGEDESCQGPTRQPNYCNNIQTDGCYNYASGESFESNFGLGGDGICNNAFRCSNIYSSTGYGQGGPHLAQALCNNGGCTKPTNLNTNPAAYCSKSQCGAECETANDCIDTTMQTTCTGLRDGEPYSIPSTKTRTGFCSLGSCSCSYSSWSDPCIAIRQDPLVTTCSCSP